MLLLRLASSGAPRTGQPAAAGIVYRSIIGDLSSPCSLATGCRWTCKQPTIRLLWDTMTKKTMLITGQEMWESPRSWGGTQYSQSRGRPQEEGVNLISASAHWQLSCQRSRRFYTEKRLQPRGKKTLGFLSLPFHLMMAPLRSEPGTFTQLLGMSGG